MLRFHQRARRRRDARGHRGALGRGGPLRRAAGGRRRPAHGIPGEAEGPPGRPAGARLHGHLHLRHGRARPRARAGRRAVEHARLRQGHHPGADPEGAGLRLPLLRREQEGGQVLARHRHARRLLRGEHGPVPGEPRVQPVRPGVAAAHVSGAGAPGEVRVRRRGPAVRAGARLGDFGRVHHLRQPHRRQRALPERARAQLLRGRAEHHHAWRAGRPPRADPARDHRPRCVRAARRAHRLQRRGGSPPAHGDRLAESSSSRRTTSRSSTSSRTRRC